MKGKSNPSTKKLSVRPCDGRRWLLSWFNLLPAVSQMYLLQPQIKELLGLGSLILTLKNDKKYKYNLVGWKSAVSKLLDQLTLGVFHQLWAAIGNFLDVVTSESVWNELKKTPLITGARHHTGESPRHGQREIAVLYVAEEISMSISTIFAKLQMLGDFMWWCHCWLHEKWCDGVLLTSRMQVQWQYLCYLLVFSNSSIPGPSKFNYRSEVLSYDAKYNQPRRYLKIFHFHWIWVKNEIKLKGLKHHSNDEKIRLMTSNAITML